MCADRKVKSPQMCGVHFWGLVVILTLSSFAVGAYGGSCREASLCCNGRDSSCVVQKAPLNAIIEDLNDKPCYCDHACLRLGDCCEDFKSHCGGKWRSFGSIALPYVKLFSYISDYANGRLCAWMNSYRSNGRDLVRRSWRLFWAILNL